MAPQLGDGIGVLLERAATRMRVGRARNSESPVVVMGTGGSGTRAAQLLVDNSGYFMGTNLNRAGDALEIGRFLRRWTNSYLESGWIREAVDGSTARFPHPRGMEEEFRAAAETHRSAIPDPGAPWGWKAPRTVLVLPFALEMYRGLKVIHVVRDGRDMAYSTNRNQLTAHGPAVLAPGELEQRVPIRAITFWSRVNVAAARFCERRLADSYLRIRYEDLCERPAEEATRLLRFLSGPASPERLRRLAKRAIRPSASTGFWREYHPHEVEALEEAGGAALREFGYL
jgi:Sulfotransferase family